MNWKSWFFYIVSLCLIAYGLYTMYHYGDYDEKIRTTGDMAGHIVGADAYNFIIIGVRGLGWILVGAISAVFGGIIEVVGLKNANRNRMKKQLKMMKQSETE